MGVVFVVKNATINKNASVYGEAYLNNIKK
jgi:hypothetical protein